MYSTINFKTKKSLKDYVTRYNALQDMAIRVGKEEAEKRSMEYYGYVPQAVRIYQPNQMFPSAQTQPTYTGPASLEGPWYPEPHRWYARVHVENGIIKKVT